MTLTVAALTLGTANLGNLFEEMSDGAAEAVLAAAWDCGVRSFDTAPHYGLGLAERRLGDFLRQVPDGSFRVSTKVGRLLVGNSGVRGRDGEFPWDTDLFVVRADTRRVWDFTGSGIRESARRSLDRLGLDRVDTLYLHDPEESPDPDAALGGGLEVLATLRADGVVSRIGVGSKSVPTLETAAAQGNVDELMVAGRNTLIDGSALPRLLPRCLAGRIRVVSASVFNSGLLATTSPGGRFEYGAAPPDVLVRARRIAEVCAAHGTDLPTAALHYAALHPSVTSVVVGAHTPEQIRQNAARASAPPGPDLWLALAAESLVPRLEPT